MIPEEAVAAAELAAHDSAPMWRWNEMNRDECREFFTNILEAAAPHMKFDAWDEGYLAHMSDGYDYQTTNPFRSQQ